MGNEVIPDDVKQFLLQYIDSIVQWEGLMLARAQPETEWSAVTIAGRLYISEAEAAQLLAQLSTDGFLAPSKHDAPLYRYKLSPPAREEIINRTAELYTRHLVPITHFIHSKHKTKVQQFADAFKIRKD